MPKSCSVVGCNSSARMPERKFFRFPMLNQRNAKSLAITQTRQNLWVKALNRADFFPSRFKYATVCDRHFVSGKSAKYTDVDDVDWVPTLNLGYTRYTIQIVPGEPQHYNEQLELSAANIKQELDEENVERELIEPNVLRELNEANVLRELNLEFTEANIKQELNEANAERESTEDNVPRESNSEFNEANVKQELNSDDKDAPTKEEEEQTNVLKYSVHTQTDDKFTGMSSDIILNYEERIAFLEEMLCSNTGTLDKFR